MGNGQGTFRKRITPSQAQGDYPLPTFTRDGIHNRWYAGEMGWIKSAAKYGASAVGAVAVIGLQTSPETVSANAAKWLGFITGQVPHWPKELDLWLSVLAFILALLPLWMWLYPRYKSRRHQKEMGGLVDHISNFSSALRAGNKSRLPSETDGDVLGRFESKVRKLDVALSAHGITLPLGYYSESIDDIIDRFEGIAGALKRGDLVAAKLAASRS